MRYSWILLVSILSVPALILATSTVNKKCEQCNANQWVITNITLKYENNTKEINAKLYYNQSNSTVYNLSIVIDGCASMTNCTGNPVTTVNGVNCDSVSVAAQNFTACQIGEEAAELEKETEYLTDQNRSENELYNTVRCIDSQDSKGN